MRKERLRLSDDPYLTPYTDALVGRAEHTRQMIEQLSGSGSLADFASGHEYYGLHKTDSHWIFRDWAPNATAITLIGDFSNWQRDKRFDLCRLNANGDWEIRLPHYLLRHGMHYRLLMQWNGGEGERIPAYARRVVQDPNTKIFSAQVWQPETPYQWHSTTPEHPEFLTIYEAHVGMAQEKYGVGTYCEFKRGVLPRIVEAGYNTLQLMALAEHPYYGSFGYHVSSFFAPSSRFGTPEELKSLIDAAHAKGLFVIMDIVHSHAVKNEVEGISCYDGSRHQYFHEGPRGDHKAWDSRCFDYGKSQVLHFLLSNCRYWLDEFHIDGYRFDGVTSMLYHDRGLGGAFTHYGLYFSGNVDHDALSYLSLANHVIHHVRPDAITIAEDVSGMPGLGAPQDEGGCGFDYRLAMGVPDCLFKLANDIRDEDWSMDMLWHELTNRRMDEKTISYVECHDQALVGGKSMIFELMDKEIYTDMHKESDHMIVDRALALHKMLRMLTLGTSAYGYLNFIGNEFGHPEWVDFPREGNNWSYHHARRQWRLRDDLNLKFHYLADFDEDIMKLAKTEPAFRIHQANKLVIDNNRKLLFFGRGNLLFFFNFHPHQSYSDLQVEALPGNYELLLNTDENSYGGHGRISSPQTYTALENVDNKARRWLLHLYLPARSGLVLGRHKPDQTIRIGNH